MSPLKNKQAVPEKCKFWPQCRNGDSCRFYHPTAAVACRSFPNCKFGETCRFTHPPCKYDERCTKSACPYTHKLRSKLQTSPVSSPVSGFMFPSPSVLVPSSPSVPPIPCKFHPSCTKVDCPFYHPQPKKANGEPPVRSLSTGEESEERAIVLPCELVESLSCQSSDCKQVVSQFKENLLCSEASLDNPDVETKALIRRFTLEAICFDRLDVVQHLREITPAGTTGPVLPENLQIQDMSSQQRTDLTVALTVTDRWQLVAERFGLNRDRITFLNTRYKNPADALLAHISRQGPLTVGYLYDLLCECDLHVIADKL